MATAAIGSANGPNRGNAAVLVNGKVVDVIDL
jgi:hypothetical protein